MHDIDIRRRAQRDLDRLPRGDAQAVSRAILELAQTPRPRGADRLRSNGRYWRIRQGDYRIVYDIDDSRQLVTVVRIGHRREVYRSL